MRDKTIDLFSRRRFLKNCACMWALCAAASVHAMEPESFMQEADYGPMPIPAPVWLRNALIAEVPTRGFNVSNYSDPGSWKGPYGDTTYRGIAAKLDYLKEMGFNALCLYSVYNCTPDTNLYALRYTEPNPDMGTLGDVKALIAEAHRREMRVMSNTNHYGVHVTSPLLSEHPDWFLPTDQKIAGQRIFDLNHPKVREYIVSSHVRWCTETGLDGWRIDLGSNVFKKSIWSEVVARCAAKGKHIVLAPENRPLVGYIQGSGRHGYPAIFDMQNSDWLKPVRSADDPYLLKEVSGHNAGERADPNHGCAFNSPEGETCGREGCFQVKGSRFIYGHNSLFAPMVPWMLVGETFNATHLALPVTKYTPKMLHAWLDWREVDAQRSVVDDFRIIGRIRSANQDLFHNNIHETNLMNVPYTAQPTSEAKPYARHIPGKKAAIVIGNSSVTEDVTFTLQVPLASMGLNEAAELYVVDCWTNTTTKVSAGALGNYAVHVPKDKASGGGVRVLLIARSDPAHN